MKVRLVFALVAMKSRRALLVKSSVVVPDAAMGVKIPSEFSPTGFRLPCKVVLALLAFVNLIPDSSKASSG